MADEGTSGGLSPGDAHLIRLALGALPYSADAELTARLNGVTSVDALIEWLTQFGQVLEGVADRNRETMAQRNRMAGDLQAIGRALRSAMDAADREAGR